jgi:TonB family protein
MTTALLSAWSTVGPRLADHLWQSTLFVVGAALVARALRRSQARVRHCVWITASAKFLVPFSLMVAAGSHLGWSTAAPGAPRVAAAVETVSRPFSRTEILAAVQSGSGSARAETARAGSVMSSVLLAMWFAGCATVLLARGLSVRTIARQVRRAQRIEDGREHAAWRRLQDAGRVRPSVTLLSSTAILEPSVVGIVKPAVLWPAAASDLLDDAQLDAILVHELAHVRRRDNLAGAMHMVVEAVFWFHPVVWWLAARLVDAREAACDEAVLAHGTEPRRYAEGLLTMCRLCLESPLPCVAGVTGSSLTRRVERIMTCAFAPKLQPGTRLLLATAAAAALVGPIAVGVMSPMPVRAQSAIDWPSPVTAGPAVIDVAAEARDVARHEVSRAERKALPSRLYVLKSRDAPPTLPESSLETMPTPTASRAPADTPEAVPDSVVDAASTLASGGASLDDIEDPTPVRRVGAKYTTAAMEAKVQGVVWLDVVVLANGTVGEVKLVKSVDPTFGLDDQAIQAARSWLFQPATRLDPVTHQRVPVPTVARLELDFRLH